MFEHLKDTVNCVACGKERHITVKDVYDMSQTKNKEYRWKHAFQLPSLFQTLPNRSHYLKINPNNKGEFNARINMDCAETAVKLKMYAQKYIAAFEEKSVQGMGTKTLGKKRLYKQNASHLFRVSFVIALPVFPFS
uniref:Uncharacterized protein n=1 Tax=Wuchereria bancrofti TaxID=6293 RepID=A0AAF5Q6U9_WUCBA